MEDEFLKAFNERRRLRAEQDRTFTIGETALTYRAAVAPEIPLRFEEVTSAGAIWADQVTEILRNANGDTPDLPEPPYTDADIIRTYDDVILACLEDESHAAWAKLRAPEAAYPLLGEEVYRLAVYLIGRTTGLPTDGLLGSSSTQPETETTSKENSPSPARKRKTSAPSSPQPTPS